MKPRRDITLGEMQVECKKYWNNGNLGSCGKCQYMEVCCHYEDYAPARLNLTDPPRFNEQQMALLNVLWNMGARIAYQLENTTMFYRKAAKDEQVAVIYNRVIDFALQDGETLDLAELLGKDGESK